MHAAHGQDLVAVGYSEKCLFESIVVCVHVGKARMMSCLNSCSAGIKRISADTLIIGPLRDLLHLMTCLAA